MTDSQKQNAWAIGILATLGVVLYFTRDKWKPFLFPEAEDNGLNDKEDATADTASNQTTPPPVVTEEKPKILNVYSKYKGTGITLSVAGTQPANPIVQGNKIRVTENKGENIGQFIKYVTIFAVPFALFKDSYSGRNALVSKTAVTVK